MANFNFPAGTSSPPAYNAVNFNFSAIPFQTILPAGWDSLAAPTQDVSAQDREIFAYPWQSSVADAPIIANFDSQYAVQGWLSELFSTNHALLNNDVYIFNTTAGLTELFGGHSLINDSQGGVSAGWDSLVIPSTHLFENLDRTLPLTGIESDLLFGTAFFEYLDREIPFDSFVPHIFPDTHALINENEYLFPEGFYDADSGFATINDGTQFINPQGITYAGFWDNHPVILDTTDKAYPLGLESLEFPTHGIRNNNYILQLTGFDSFGVGGDSYIYNSTQVVQPLDFLDSQAAFPITHIISDQAFYFKPADVLTTTYGSPAITNAARAIYFTGFTSSSPSMESVTHGIRGVDASGFNAFYSSGFHIIYSDGQLVIDPSCGDTAGFGTPLIEDLTQNIRAPGIPAPGFGDAFIADSERNIRAGAYFMGFNLVPPPVVENSTRYLDIPSIDSLFVSHDADVEERFTVIKPQVFLPTEFSNGAMIRNETPEISPTGFFSTHSAQQFGAAELSHYTRYLTPPGWDGVLVDPPDIVNANREYLLLGVPPPVFLNNHIVTGVFPPGPYTQQVLPLGIPPAVGQIPLHELINMGLSLNGIDSLEFGQAVIASNTIFVTAFNIITEFSIPTIENAATQYLAPETLGDTLLFLEGAAVTEPQYIHCDMSYFPSKGLQQCSLMDKYIHPEISAFSCTPSSPWTLFGRPTIETFHREILVAGHDSLSTSGSAFIDNADTKIDPQGFLPTVVGIPEISDGLRINPYWYTDFPEDFAEFITDLTPYTQPDFIGEHEIALESQQPPFDLFIYPLPFAPTSHGLQFIENFNRELYPQGHSDSIISAEHAIWYDPREVPVQGFSSMSIPDTHYISFYNREFALTGWASDTWDYDFEHPGTRMTIRQEATGGFVGFDSLAVGTPTIGDTMNNIAVPGFNSLIITNHYVRVVC